MNLYFTFTNKFNYQIPLILQFLVVLPLQISSDMGLEHGDDLGQTLISHLLQHTQDSGLEEDLGVTETVLCRVQLQSEQDLLRNDLSVRKAIWDSIRGQDGVSENENWLAIMEFQSISRMHGNNTWIQGYALVSERRNRKFVRRNRKSRMQRMQEKVKEVD